MTTVTNFVELLRTHKQLQKNKWNDIKGIYVFFTDNVEHGNYDTWRATPMEVRVAYYQQKGTSDRCGNGSRTKASGLWIFYFV